MTFVVHYLSCYPYKIVGVVIKVLSPLLYCWDTSWILYLVAVTLVYCMNMIVGGGFARDLRSWLLGRAMLSDGTLYVIICVHGCVNCSIWGLGVGVLSHLWVLYISVIAQGVCLGETGMPFVSLKYWPLYDLIVCNNKVVCVGSLMVMVLYCWHVYW